MKEKTTLQIVADWMAVGLTENPLNRCFKTRVSKSVLVIERVPKSEFKRQFLKKKK